MKRREILAQIAASLGTTLLPWELIHAAKAGFGGDTAPMSKLLPSLPDRKGRGKVTSDVMIRVRDGIRLATDVYLPEGSGPFPTVLTRLPYALSDQRRGFSGNVTAV